MSTRPPSRELLLSYTNPLAAICTIRHTMQYSDLSMGIVASFLYFLPPVRFRCAIGWSALCMWSEQPACDTLAHILCCCRMLLVRIGRHFKMMRAELLTEPYVYSWRTALNYSCNEQNVEMLSIMKLSAAESFFSLTHRYILFIEPS